jgi:hypothetical protein
MGLFGPLRRLRVLAECRGNPECVMPSRSSSLSPRYQFTDSLFGRLARRPRGRPAPQISIWGPYSTSEYNDDLGRVAVCEQRAKRPHGERKAKLASNGSNLARNGDFDEPAIIDVCMHTNGGTFHRPYQKTSPTGGPPAQHAASFFTSIKRRRDRG